jgi:hypothetical protein
VVIGTTAGAPPQRYAHRQGQREGNHLAPVFQIADQRGDDGPTLSCGKAVEHVAAYGTGDQKSEERDQGVRVAPTSRSVLPKSPDQQADQQQREAEPDEKFAGVLGTQARQSAYPAVMHEQTPEAFVQNEGVVNEDQRKRR